MSTWIGRWLATHVGFFARRWQRRVRAELAAEAKKQLVAARAEVNVRAAVFVDSLGADPEKQNQAALVAAVCHERNVFLQYVELTGGVVARYNAESALLQSYQYSRRSLQAPAPASNGAWACSAHGITETAEPCCTDAVAISSDQVEAMLAATAEHDANAKGGTS